MASSNPKAAGRMCSCIFLPWRRRVYPHSMKVSKSSSRSSATVENHPGRILRSSDLGDQIALKQEAGGTIGPTRNDLDLGATAEWYLTVRCANLKCERL